jgi:hypothetical protein
MPLSRRRLESAIYEATPKDYRLRRSGRTWILMLRRGMTTLVPLDTLSDDELHEAAEKAGVDAAGVEPARAARSKRGNLDAHLGEIGQGMTTTVRGITVTRWGPNRFELDTLGRSREGHALEEAARLIVQRSRAPKGRCSCGHAASQHGMGGAGPCVHSAKGHYCPCLRFKAS